MSKTVPQKFSLIGINGYSIPNPPWAVRVSPSFTVLNEEEVEKLLTAGGGNISSDDEEDLVSQAAEALVSIKDVNPDPSAYLSPIIFEIHEELRQIKEAQRALNKRFDDAVAHSQKSTPVDIDLTGDNFFASAKKLISKKI